MTDVLHAFLSIPKFVTENQKQENVWWCMEPLLDLMGQWTVVKTQIFIVSPFNITPVKRAHKARARWYYWAFRLNNQCQIKEKYFLKEWTETNLFNMII